MTITVNQYFLATGGGMKRDALDEQLATPAVWTALRARLLVGAALVIALALLAQAGLAWRQDRAAVLALGKPGELVTVMLVNSQIYYGTLLESTPAYVKLGDVYYTQSFVQPNGQQANRVVSRKKNDWHGPEWQVIPAEKILFVERVGADSQLARLIAQDQTAVKAP
jgi:hypothetical protein